MIKTERLILRPWQESDTEPFACMNADPRVMECFPSILTFEESRDFKARILDHFEKNGWGLWAVSCPGVSDFVGFIGLSTPSFTSHFTPCVEVGWRLAFEYWGKGYATEGAQAALAYGFDVLHLKEIVSFTAAQNMRSRRVMEKIGMQYNPQDDFDHPKLFDGHPLKKHVLYRINSQSK